MLTHLSIRSLTLTDFSDLETNIPDTTDGLGEKDKVISELINNLKQSTTYRLLVIATNTDGSSNSSQFVQFMTSGKRFILSLAFAKCYIEFGCSRCQLLL